VYEGASKKSPELGYLHAGARVRRSPRAYETSDCTSGYYEVAPRGYVCTEGDATLALDHPTLKAMALDPKLDARLPYVYARTTKVTTLYSKVRSKKVLDKGVELSGRLSRNTAMAIVGSWTAPDESREPQALGLKLNGQFVRTDDLAPAEGSNFRGVQLGGTASLPFGFVVRRGVSSFRLDEDEPHKQLDLPYHTHLPLTGKYRTVRGGEMWALPDNLWVRHQDVTIIQKRHTLPEFARDKQYRDRYVSALRGSESHLRNAGFSRTGPLSRSEDDRLHLARNLQGRRQAHHAAKLGQPRRSAARRSLGTRARKRPVLDRESPS
jgi:hypothetical protein